MLVAAAVCPCPPLLVPDVAQRAAPELDPLRAACDEAVRALVEAAPDLVVVVGTGGRDVLHEAGSTGSFRGFGVPMDVTLGEGRGDAGPAVLPPPLAVGAWLLSRSGWTGPVRGYEVSTHGRSTAANGEDGTNLAGSGERVGFLVMGDGSARRDVKAPGYLDERAAAVDAAIAKALANGDRDGFLLGDLDETLARDLMISGRSPWQILSAAHEDDLDCRLLFDDAPYGVGYFVASWT
ncbi:class III extradiol dioxygenase subunit B-like domain-containing protein [Streptomyces abyssomicinicus]|uniref:class III extradiol dioxygenase subunit B-like domain-containing protein n=1 Tax=Streptomyces abyssomicinicus TaxID=574929 RepID=UPI00124F9126|nr:class III extradiol dioxygenase subunit B-like domain-containing protein [Streptomyces abyssomicinicus]